MIVIWPLQVATETGNPLLGESAWPFHIAQFARK